MGTSLPPYYGKDCRFRRVICRHRHCHPVLFVPRSLVSASLLAPSAALAADEGLSLAGTVGQMVLGLGLVLALMFGALFLIKKLSLPRGPAAASLRVVGATAVGPRERVVLVEVGDKLLVLGVAPGQIEGLHTFEASEFPSPVPDAAAPQATGTFADRLRQIMERRT